MHDSTSSPSHQRPSHWSARGMLDAEKRSCAWVRAVPGLVCAAMLAVPPAAALDVRYVDTDGDLVADTPAKTVDPPTLIFAYTPGEDPASYQRVWDDFPAASGKDDRKAHSVVCGAKQCGADRGDARGPPPHRRVWDGHGADRRQLRRVRP